MEKVIQERIQAVNNPEAIKLFFDLLNKLIVTLGISPDNEKLAINIRVKNKKRISVNLNSRLALAIRENGENLTFMFMINKIDHEEIAQRYFLINNWPFKEEQLQVFLIELPFNELLKKDNNGLVNAWLKSCQQYEPKQSRSQYRRLHVPELYKIATDPHLLNKYMSGSTEEILIIEKPFKNIINDFREYLKLDTTILNSFIVHDVKPRCNWTWIEDSQHIIANIIAHYEIVKEGDVLNMDIHFEGKKSEKDQFKNKLKSLPEKAIWLKWHNSNSIRFVDSIPLHANNLNQKLRDALLYLEENLGDEIRSIIKQKPVSNQQNKSSLMKSPLNQILFGPPGTGKTYNTINKALEILGERTEGIDRSTLKTNFERRVADGQIMFTTFHQSMSYEDFIEGLKPQEAFDKEGNTIITYKVEPGIFKIICEAARVEENSDNFEDVYEQFAEDVQTEGSILLRTPRHSKPFKVAVNSNKNFIARPETDTATPMVITKEMVRNFIFQGKIKDWKPYTVGISEHIKANYKLTVVDQTKQKLDHVLIIDEINRGNVSQIFGELITLIEDDKRLGRKEQLEVTLPYSKEKFGVPANLYIIGTMNTADRSVEALDTALRRRFSFVEMPPRYDLEELQREVNGYKLTDILKKINRRIEKLLDKDHLIGHSYFLSVQNPEDLRRAFQSKIMPLLQEYFFGDYGKIGLILGEGFFKEAEEQEDDIFATFRNYETGGLAEKEVHHLADLIGANRLTDEEFQKALDALMK